MALWCKDYPLVSVPRGTAPKPFTLILPYYENPRFLAEQVQGWWSWPESIRPYVSLILVDDGSPDPARRPTLPFPVRLFRIAVDVRWNWLAARNIGAHHADPGWLVLTDMDHVLPKQTAEAIIWGAHNPALVYAFSRVEHTGAPIHPHSASFLMTKEKFWDIGGYDEALSGFYGSDGDYRRRLAQRAQIQILRDPLVRFEYVQDSSTTRYLRKQPYDAGLKLVVASRRPGWRPMVLSFPYHEVAA